MNLLRRARSWIARVCRGATSPADQGAVAVEYALLAGLVALAIVGALRNLGNAIISLPLNAIGEAMAGVLS